MPKQRCCFFDIKKVYACGYFSGIALLFDDLQFVSQSYISIISTYVENLFMNRILTTTYVFEISLTLLIVAIFHANTTFATSILMSTNMNPQNTSGLSIQSVELNIKDITISKTSQNTTNVRITFGAHNPQTSTVLLDGIHYNIYVNNLTVSSGDIGSEALIDVMRSEPEFPIIGNDTILLRDAQTIHTKEVKDDISNVMNAGNACFTVNGTYFYRQAAGLAASGGTNEFHTAFPNNCK